MKLIDVNTLKEWIENWFVEAVFYLPYNNSNDISIPELYGILERMPTVEAIPVKWLKTWIDTVLYQELYHDYEREFWMKYADHVIEIFNLGVTEDEMEMAYLRWKMGEKWALRGYEDYENE